DPSLDGRLDLWLVHPTPLRLVTQRICERLPERDERGPERKLGEASATLDLPLQPQSALNSAQSSSATARAASNTRLPQRDLNRDRRNTMSKKLEGKIALITGGSRGI